MKSNMMFFAAIGILCVLAALNTASSCTWTSENDGDDDQSDGDDFDDDTDDDGSASGPDDDDNDDDDNDGGDDDETAPRLSNARWEPTYIEGDGTSALTFSVCDEVGDLDGGRIFVWTAGTPDPFMGFELSWDDIDEAFDATNCDAPAEVAFDVDFDGAPAGAYCCDVAVTDGDDNVSNKISNLCVGVGSGAPGGPILSEGFWNPSVLGGDLISALTFSVCDVEDDLEGGQVFVWNAGTQDEFLAGPIYWEDFGDVPHATDCDNPVPLGINVNFIGAPPGTYCCDLEATDGDGHLSNTLTDLCATVP